MKIAAAGNTEVPAYLSLVELGFEVSVDRNNKGVESWKAANTEAEIIGSSPLEILALVKLIECRGKDWKANDEEIEEFISKYYNPTS